MSDLSKVQDAAKNRFEGLSNQVIAEYYKIVFNKYPEARMKPGEVKSQLMLHFDLPAEFPSKDITEAQKDRLKLSRAPALTPGDKWAGRRRTITIQPSDIYKKGMLVYLNWQGSVCYVPVGVPVDLPWPHWQILKNAIEDKINTVEQFNKTIGRHEIVEVVSPTPSYNYQDHGDTKGTEHLPCSLIDYYVTKAENSAGFGDGYSRAALERIVSVLEDGAVSKDIKRMTDPEVREYLLSKLGILERYTEVDYA